MFCIPDSLQYRCHRGGVYYTPENTMPAFRQAMVNGYDQIETDPQITRDGVIVLMHDDTINRTCRNGDGSEIEIPIRVADVTYEELLTYDAGIRMGETFRGTKIPRLDELLKEAEGSSVQISLDKKISTDRVDLLIDLVEKYNTKVSFSTSSIVRIEKIQSRIPYALFDYDVNLEEEALQAVCRLVQPERLTVWMYLDKPNFSWLTQNAKVSPKRFAMVKRYARVGIANINNPLDVKEALDYFPDVIEL